VLERDMIVVNMIEKVVEINEFQLYLEISYASTKKANTRKLRVHITSGGIVGGVYT
jgi:hypothetical protein